MKKFGEFQPGNRVVSAESVGNMHIRVPSLTELNTRLKQQVAILSGNSGSFKYGDTIIKNESGSWIKLESMVRTLGGVTKLRGYKKGNRAYIRWRDPVAVTNRDGVVQVDWKETILIRKYGSAPQNLLDGVVVYRERVVRDQFNEPGSVAFCEPICDSDKDSNWYYQAFSVADNGYISKCATPLRLTDLDWESVRTRVHDGEALQLFSIGDILALSDGTELIVASIDTAKPASSNYQHTVTFLFNYPINPVPFDCAKGSYQLSRDTVITRGKTYYILKNGKYTKAGTTGTTIDEPNLTYYEKVSASRAEDGINVWKYSDLRTWCHEKDPSRFQTTMSTWLTAIGNPATPYQFIVDKDAELAKIIIETITTTRYPKTDGTGTYETKDLFYVPSITEFTGQTNEGASEGTQFKLYSEGIDVPDAYTYPYVTDNGKVVYRTANLWTRSPLFTIVNDSGTDVHYIDDTGSTVNTKIARESCGCILAFNIG